MKNFRNGEVGKTGNTLPSKHGNLISSLQKENKETCFVPKGTITIKTRVTKCIG